MKSDTEQKNMQKNKTRSCAILIIALLIVLVVVYFLQNKQPSPAPATPNELGLSKETIIEKAKEELRRHELPLEEMVAEADKENSAWQKHTTVSPLVLESEIVKRLNLDEKDYWAVYFGPKVSRPGWDAWVFVDAGSGEIIGLILGE